MPGWLCSVLAGRYVIIQIPQALTTILILFIDLGTDMVPAISMAWENAENDIMRRPPRHAGVDRLVTNKLIVFAYVEIGVIQSIAGFFAFFVALHDFGFPSHMLLGAAQFDLFTYSTIYCKNNAPQGVVKFVTLAFDPSVELDRQHDEVSDVWTPDHLLWYDTRPNAATRFGDERIGCTFAGRNVLGLAKGNAPANPATLDTGCPLREDGSARSVEQCFDPADLASYFAQAVAEDGNVVATPTGQLDLFTADTLVESFEEQLNLVHSGYVPYVPWKGKNSPFWDNAWLHQDIYGEYDTYISSVPGLGRAEGVALKAADADGNCEGFPTDSSRCWRNVPAGTSVNALLFFGHQALARFVTGAPTVDPATGVIDLLSDPAAVNAGLLRNRYGYNADEARVEIGNPGYFVTAQGQRVTLIRSEIQDRQGLVGSLSSNTYALSKHWLGCEASSGGKVGTECLAKDGRTFDNSTETGCTEACALMPYGYYNAALEFTETSVYAGGAYSIPDWSNFRNLTCDMTGKYDPQLSRKAGVFAPPAPADFCRFNRRGYEFNVASRMVQREALGHAQTAFFVSVVIQQWANLIICKTRMNSIREQGMLNSFLNFGLIFETAITVVLCYTPYMNVAIGFRPIRFMHWMPGMPYSFSIIIFDEARKFFMRRTSSSLLNPVTGQTVRIPGWLERNTYY